MRVDGSVVDVVGPTEPGERAARWRRTAATLWSDGRRELAADLLARACRLDPTDPVLTETAARAQFEAGQVLGARASFAALLAVSPGDAFALYALGVCDARLGDRAGALRYLTAAVHADPAEPRFGQALAIVRAGSSPLAAGAEGDPGVPGLGGRTAGAPLFARESADPVPPDLEEEHHVTSPTDPIAPLWLWSADRPLVEEFDVALLDLDGTVHLGGRPVPGAAGAIAAARAAGLRPQFVTNNASRTPAEVVGTLQAAGVSCEAGEVLTSAQVAAQALAARLDAGAPVLVVGGSGLWEALEAEGLRPVDSTTAHPVAVVQGWSADVGWTQLAEAAYALADEATLWVATNLDLTLPTERGTAPGNGSLVGLLARVLHRDPDLVVGKPEPMLLQVAAARAAATRPLVVGDRLDTDIAGGARADLPTLLVLTGVTGPADLLRAGPDERPSFVSADLTGLLVAHPPVWPDGAGWRCEAATAEVVDGVLIGGPVVAGEDPAENLDLLRALAAAAWAASDAGTPWRPDPRLAGLLSPGRTAVAGGRAATRPA